MRRGLDLVGVAAFGSLSAATFGLGCWQVKRYSWKVDLVESRRRRLAADAVPVGESQMGRLPFEKVRCSGTFAYADSLFVGPRSAPQGTDAAAAAAMAPSGFFVVTPFVDAESGRTLLVHRGWVPRRQRAQALEASEAATGTATFDAVVRVDEVGGVFTPERPSVDDVDYFRIDADAMKRQRDLPPDTFFVEQIRAPDNALAQGALACRSAQDLLFFQVHPSTHVGYAATWFGLCLAGLLLTRRRFFVAKRL